MLQEEKVMVPVQTTFLQAPIKCCLPIYTYVSHVDSLHSLAAHP
jgi:hypothetical protein